MGTTRFNIKKHPERFPVLHGFFEMGLVAAVKFVYRNASGAGTRKKHITSGSVAAVVILSMAHTDNGSFYTYGVRTVNLGFLVPEVDGVLGRMLSTMLAQGR